MPTDFANVPYQWRSASLSDAGFVREVNEDACLELPDSGIWLVADGMGGHEGGAFASRTVVEALSEIGPARCLGTSIDRISNRLQDANRRLREEAARRGERLVGTTAVVLLLHGRHSVCLWVGDSRVYRLRSGVLRQLTRDHRWVNEQAAQGRITPDMAERHPLAHEITRAVGAEESLNLSLAIHELAAADKFLLCSDGLYDEVSEQDISRLLGQEDLSQCCRDMIGHAKRNGARDNVTVVAVQVTKAG